MKNEFFLIVEFKLMNVERMMDIEKSQFGNYHSYNCCRQELLRDVKLGG